MVGVHKNFFASSIWLACTRCMLGMLMAFTHPHAWCLELNQANVAELDSLKGMGPSLSSKVLAARDIHPFTSWADFRQRVSGVGIAKARQFSEQGLTVAGQVFSEAPPAVQNQTLP